MRGSGARMCQAGGRAEGLAWNTVAQGRSGPAMEGRPQAVGAESETADIQAARISGTGMCRIAVNP